MTKIDHAAIEERHCSDTALRLKQAIAGQQWDVIGEIVGSFCHEGIRVEVDSIGICSFDVSVDDEVPKEFRQFAYGMVGTATQALRSWTGHRCYRRSYWSWPITYLTA